MLIVFLLLLEYLLAVPYTCLQSAFMLNLYGLLNLGTYNFDGQ